MWFSAENSPHNAILRIAGRYRVVKRSASVMLETDGDARSVKLTQKTPKELKKTQQVPVAHRIPEPGKPGSLAAIAQLVEHFLGKEEVPGPNPGSSSIGERNGWSKRCEVGSESPTRRIKKTLLSDLYRGR